MSISDLNDRKKQILKAIVEAHVRDGGPVGSRYLTESGRITLSSATIRNEMAELEEMGYLEQPHTSAGRVPSQSGYRLYVDSLMPKQDMSRDELFKLNALARSRLAEVDKLLETASKLCSVLTNYSSISVRQHSGGKADSFRLVLLADKSIMLIIVSGGAVNTKQLMIETAVTADMLRKLEAILNNRLAGLSASEITFPLIMEIEREFEYDDNLVQLIAKAICGMLGVDGESEVQLAGVNHLLEYPEYSDMGKFRELLSVLEEKRDILKLVDESPEDEEAQVIIGSESSVAEMSNSSIVFKKIRQGGRVVGAIGVIGPRRMDYGKVISTVDCVAENLENMLSGNYIGDGGKKG